MTCDPDITHLLYIYLDINLGCIFSLQSLKKEIDWERSTEERSASSEISADYRLPPDPVSPSFSGEFYIYIYKIYIYIYIYIHIYIYISNLLTTFYSRILSLLCISIYIYYIMINVSLSFAIVGRSCALRMRWRSTAPSPFKLQLQLHVAMHYATSLLWPNHDGSFVTCYPVWRQTRLWSIVDAYKRILLHPKVRYGDCIRTYTRARTRVCASNSLCMWVSCMCPSALLFAALPANLIELSRYQRNCNRASRGLWSMISQKAGFSFVSALYL